MQEFNRTKESIKFAPDLQTIRQVPKAGDICHIAGWGSTRPVLTVTEIYLPKNNSERLLETKVSLWNIDKCFKKYEQARLQRELAGALANFHVNKDMNICALGKKGRNPFVRDSCYVSLCNLKCNFFTRLVC